MAQLCCFQRSGCGYFPTGSCLLGVIIHRPAVVAPQIQDIIVETGQADQKETRSAKDALLLWCQMKTAG